MYLENYILKMIRHQTVNCVKIPERIGEMTGQKNLFFMDRK